MLKKLTLTNNIDEIPRLSEFIELTCEEMGFDMSTTMSINLALEEAVVNVIQYAYPNGTEGAVDIDIADDDRQATFTITDSGKPFDPTAKADVDISLSAEERPIGGLGIHLIRQIMDSIQYERKNNKNILTLKKNK
jgi:anti-sigma regulatory factor (Ser/Thr protein kinase)